MSKQKLTSISSLGEFGLIDRLTNAWPVYQKSTFKAMGDDAAVIDFGKEQTIVSTDILTEGVHFDLAYTPLKHLGYKAVVVNLSDIVAMNAQPTQILVSIAVSARTSVEALDELYLGIKEACKTYQVDLVGGDTTSSKSGLFISITAIGKALPNDLVYRKGAKINDLICVTGNLGAAYMGLQLLIREKEVFAVNPNSQPDLSQWDYIIERQLKPETPINLRKKLNDMGVKPSSMIDISDGLSSEILHICQQSNLGCRIYEEKIPIHEQTIKFGYEIKVDASIAAMNGGEDYEILFTVPMTDFETIKRYPEIQIIGHMVEADKQCALVARDGTNLILEAQGFNHASSVS